MTKTMHVIYDGKVLKPCEPVDLKKNVEYIVIIKSESKKKNDFCNVLKSIAGTVEGPEDWAEEHDHYIYGDPRGTELEKTRSRGRSSKKRKKRFEKSKNSKKMPNSACTTTF